MSAGVGDEARVGPFLADQGLAACRNPPEDQVVDLGGSLRGEGGQESAQSDAERHEAARPGRLAQPGCGVRHRV